MTTVKPINLYAFTEHKQVLNLWLSIIMLGPLLFCGLLILSYFVLNAPSIVHNASAYRNAEAALGFGEMAGLAIAIFALFRYLSLKTKYRKQTFDQLVEDNDWSKLKEYKTSRVASILLGAGISYEQRYIFSGDYIGHAFNCVAFQFETASSGTRSYICLSFKLSKAYPMIVIDNRLNDHGYRYHDSNLPNGIPNGVSINLEGGFNRYYEVSSTRGNERDAVAVLSPDFMALLADDVSYKVDIEINDKDLFLIYEDDFYTEKNMIALFTVAEGVLGKLDKSSKTWLASSKWQEGMIAQSAQTARHKLISKPDLISIIGFFIISVVFLAAIIWNVVGQ